MKTSGWTAGQKFAQNVARRCLDTARRHYDLGNMAAVRECVWLAMHHRNARRNKTDWAKP